MELDPAYYAEDTDGVHFQVFVDGIRVWAFVGRAVLEACFGPKRDEQEWASLYVANRSELDAFVTMCARLRGPETVIVTREELFLFESGNPDGQSIP